jgi:hypothetical protein
MRASVPMRVLCRPWREADRAAETAWMNRSRWQKRSGGAIRGPPHHMGPLCRSSELVRGCWIAFFVVCWLNPHWFLFWVSVVSSSHLVSHGFGFPAEHRVSLFYQCYLPDRRRPGLPSGSAGVKSPASLSCDFRVAFRRPKAAVRKTVGTWCRRRLSGNDLSGTIRSSIDYDVWCVTEDPERGTPTAWCADCTASGSRPAAVFFGSLPSCGMCPGAPKCERGQPLLLLTIIGDNDYTTDRWLAQLDADQRSPSPGILAEQCGPGRAHDRRSAMSAHTE